MEGAALFMGMKQRRRSSINKEFVGDSLRLSEKDSVTKYLAKHGDKRVLFSDSVVKVNKRLKMQERFLLISESGIYNLDGSYKLKRRIAFQDLRSVLMSTLPDNFFVLRVPGEYDYLFVSSRKTEIVLRLMAAYERALGTALPVQFSCKFEYQVEVGFIRELEFQATDGGVTTQFHSRKARQL